MFAPFSTPARLGLAALALMLALAFAATSARAQADPGASPSLQTPSVDPRRGVSLPDPQPPMTPEEAHAATSDVLLSLDVLLQVADYGNPEQQQLLRARVGLLRAALDAATPEELQVIADRMGPELRVMQSVLLQQAVLGVQASQEAEARAQSKSAAGAEPALAPVKSAGFPALRTDVPDYPAVTPQSMVVDIANGIFDTGTKDAARSFLEHVVRPYTIPLCEVGVGPDGRAERRSNEVVFLDFGAQSLLSLLNQVQNDACGGFSFDVSVVISGGASLSCQWCCALYNLIYGVLSVGYDARALCDSMVDGAELEATYQHVVTTYDAVAHVHGDVEAVQATADEILDAVTCRPVAQLNRHHGCDGFDSDCNGIIDDCREDSYGPLLHVDEAVGVPWYASQAEAVAAVLRAVSASDDCKAVTVSLDSVTGGCGAVNAAVSARDACGNTTSVTAVVKVDATAPVVAIPAAVAGSCHASIDAAEAAVLAAAVISDDCTPLGQMAVQVQSTVTDCSLRVRITATDLAGRSTSDAVTVRVDTRSPVVDVEQLALGPMPRCFETVAEAEAAVLAATSITDNCSAPGALAPAVSSSGSPCSLRVAVSTTDECGRAGSDAVTVRVDDVAPAVTAAVSTPSLWPANHELVDVGFAYTATDNCAGDPVVRVSVTSDETTSTADGAGQDKAPDAVILRNPDGSVGRILLRAERSSSGNGRVYRITVEATDPCGHVGASAVQVVVPAARANGPATDDGQYYDAAQMN